MYFSWVSDVLRYLKHVEIPNIGLKLCSNFFEICINDVLSCKTFIALYYCISHYVQFRLPYCSIFACQFNIGNLQPVRYKKWLLVRLNVHHYEIEIKRWKVKCQLTCAAWTNYRIKEHSIANRNAESVNPLQWWCQHIGSF